MNSVQIDVHLSGKNRKLQSAPGIFSYQQIDKGTAVLLKYFDSDRGENYISSLDAKMRVLDLGCGWGVLSLAVGLKKTDIAIDAVDINQHAVELTNLNAKTLELKNVNAYNPPTFKERCGQNIYNLIVSNPPIRIGKQRTLELVKTYLNQLSPTGVALFVIQKNLGSDSIADALKTKMYGGYNVQKLSSSKGFRILLVTHGR